MTQRAARRLALATLFLCAALPAAANAGVEVAERTIAPGEMSDAERRLEDFAARLARARSKLEEKEALAIYHSARLADARVDWHTAYRHFLRASTLRPADWRYARNAGRLAWQLGRYRAAVRHQEAALKAVSRRFGPDAYETALVMNELALSYTALGQYEEAERLFREARDVARSIFGMQHERTRAIERNFEDLASRRGNEALEDVH